MDFVVAAVVDPRNLPLKVCQNRVINRTDHVVVVIVIIVVVVDFVMLLFHFFLSCCCFTFFCHVMIT